MKEEAKKRSRSERNEEKKKMMMTIMSVKSECRTHMNVGEFACVSVCECVYISVSVCNIMAVLFNMRTHDIFSFTLFSRYIVYVARLFFAAKHYKRDTHTHAHIQSVSIFFVMHKTHKLALFYIHRRTHTHTHTQISQSRNGFVVFFSVAL